MSHIHDPLDIGRAFNKGHNDAWEKNSPTPPDNCLCGRIDCPVRQSYRHGHEKGLTARYYYDRGFEAGYQSA